MIQSDADGANPETRRAKEQEVAVTLEEMARILASSKDTVRRMAKDGSIPAFKVGRDWRFFPSLVIAELSKPRDPWAKSSHSRNARRREI